MVELGFKPRHFGSRIHVVLAQAVALRLGRCHGPGWHVEGVVLMGSQSAHSNCSVSVCSSSWGSTGSLLTPGEQLCASWSLDVDLVLEGAEMSRGRRGVRAGLAVLLQYLESKSLGPWPA